MLTTYYYNKQIKQYILQFANVFAGLTIKTGKGADGQVTTMDAPIVYASKDRVVASIGAGNTQNRLHTLPLMSCFMTGIEMVPERRKGVGGVDRRTFMPQGGVFLEDVKVAYRLMPIPYDLSFDVHIYASSTDQAFQILEQLLIIFDPTLEIQTSDAPLDWTKLNKIELLGLNNEESQPSGTEKRMIIWTLNFKVEAWLSPPMEVKKNIIEKIILRYGDLDKFTLFEYNENGDPEPFMEGGLWSEDIITSPFPDVEPPIPIEDFPPEDKS